MRRFAPLLVGSAVLLFLDQWTKALAVRALSVPPGHLPTDADRIRSTVEPVFGEWFRLRLAGNKGAANSMFANLPDDWRIPFLVGVSLIALAVIITLYARAKPSWERLGLVAIAGGAVGNLVDRVRLGYVVDFIQWRFGNWAFPTFNVADAAICVGVGVLVMAMLRPREVAPPLPSAQ